MKKDNAAVIGAGLAGCEAAWQLARFGADVTLYEQKPLSFSPAHSSENFAELVCSNSLRAEGLLNAVGLLKQEMRELGSLVMRAADGAKVPAGGALAVDRHKFSEYITQAIRSEERIHVVTERVSSIPEEGVVIVAAGPLVSDDLAEDIAKRAGGMLSFCDAAAPIAAAESIDMGKAFWASRYGKGSDYLNCPMNEREYREFYEALISAETAHVHGFEDGRVFEGCMPVETMAKRGFRTLLFGPLKPVGITCPDGSKPFAVVQLRREDAEGRLFNLVGFQTRLKFGGQKRVFRMIPGLQNAEFVRYGVMHRNTYINSPSLLSEYYDMKDRPGLYFAGQITGVEGYVESASSGLLAGIFAACDIAGRPRPRFSRDTACGALGAYVSGYAGADFQPMNITYGIINTIDTKGTRRDRRLAVSKRALDEIKRIKEGLLEIDGTTQA
jgi:methylenetetrahydrofolate--tRNA-(uracil-5-)-methyltransferase